MTTICTPTGTPIPSPAHYTRGAKAMFSGDSVFFCAVRCHSSALDCSTCCMQFRSYADPALLRQPSRLRWVVAGGLRLSNEGADATPWTPSPGNEFKTNFGLHGQAGLAKRFEREIMPL